MRKPILDIEEIKPIEIPQSGFMNLHCELKAESSAGFILEISDKLKAGKAVHFVNKNFWNTHELLLALLSITGPAHLIISTYAVSETAARTLALLKEEKEILSLTAMIDNRVDTRSAGSLQLLRAISDKICLTACHAKVTLLHNEQYNICLVGSANYTENKRYETGVISDCKESRIFHQNWIENAIKEHGSYNP